MHRIGWLDSARAILAWWVVVIHCYWFCGVKGSASWLLVGHLPVNCFIVISGFVITRLLLTKQEPYPVFIFRRLMRLFPAYLVCLLIAIALRPMTMGHLDMDLSREASEAAYWWQHILAHLTMLQGLAAPFLPEAETAFLVPAWSISVEWQLYIVAPMALWLISRYSYRGVGVICLLALLPMQPGIGGHLRDWSDMDALLPQKFIFFLVGMFVATLGWREPSKDQIGRIGRSFGKLGQISYSTYLVHYPIVAAVHAVTSIESPWWLLALSAPLILAASLMLYHWIELPGIHLGKALVDLNKKACAQPENAFASPRASIESQQA